MPVERQNRLEVKAKRRRERIGEREMVVKKKLFRCPLSKSRLSPSSCLARIGADLIAPTTTKMSSRRPTRHSDAAASDPTSAPAAAVRRSSPRRSASRKKIDHAAEDADDDVIVVKRPRGASQSAKRRAASSKKKKPAAASEPEDSTPPAKTPRAASASNKKKRGASTKKTKPAAAIVAGSAAASSSTAHVAKKAKGKSSAATEHPEDADISFHGFLDFRAASQASGGRVRSDRELISHWNRLSRDEQMAVARDPQLIHPPTQRVSGSGEDDVQELAESPEYSMSMLW
jgi:hypothetical protein